MSSNLENLGLPPIVSAAEWQTAHEILLAKEKAATRARDALAAERRRLPMLKIEKDYPFEGHSTAGRGVEGLGYGWRRREEYAP